MLPIRTNDLIRVFKLATGQSVRKKSLLKFENKDGIQRTARNLTFAI
jgi:hypothetical protein